MHAHNKGGNVMPNCFTLTRKGAVKPETFQIIDDEMRVHFQMEPDDVNYLYEKKCDSIPEAKVWEAWFEKEIRQRFSHIPDVKFLLTRIMEATPELQDYQTF